MVSDVVPYTAWIVWPILGSAFRKAGMAAIYPIGRSTWFCRLIVPCEDKEDRQQAAQAASEQAKKCMSQPGHVKMVVGTAHKSHLLVVWWKRDSNLGRKHTVTLYTIRPLHLLQCDPTSGLRQIGIRAVMRSVNVTDSYDADCMQDRVDVD